MDTLFYVLSLFSFSLGLLNLGGFFFLKNQVKDRGTWSIILPLIPLLFITVLLIIENYLEYRYPNKEFTLIMLLLEWSRITVALSWNFITYYHYALNGMEVFKRKSVYFLTVLSLLLCFLAGLFLFGKSSYMPIIQISVVMLFYHAGIRGVLILRKKRRLLPSTRTALTVAIISLIIYPIIGIGDPLGWRIPYLNPAKSLWIQGHPLYFLIINIPFVSYIIKGARNVKRIIPLPREELEQMKANLSKRENEVLTLLLQGLTYNQIAETLFISLPTVKTHIQHIYSKFGIKRREELFIAVGKQPM